MDKIRRLNDSESHISKLENKKDSFTQNNYLFYKNNICLDKIRKPCEDNNIIIGCYPV